MKRTTHLLLKSLALVAGIGAAPLAAALENAGQATYLQNCAACHQPDGKGLAGAFPPLADADDVTGTFMSRGTPSRTIRIPSGNFSAPASFERLPWWARLAVVSGGTPDTSAAPVYTYVQEPPLRCSICAP